MVEKEWSKRGGRRGVGEEGWSKSRSSGGRVVVEEKWWKSRGRRVVVEEQ